LARALQVPDVVNVERGGNVSLHALRRRQRTRGTDRRHADRRVHAVARRELSCVHLVAAIGEQLDAR